jgi:FixJ family two-component response regulator
VTRAPVFVIDDEEPVRRGLGKLLTTLGYETTTFPSAESFLEAHGDDRVGCLVLDIRMPGMSGLDLIDELRRRQSPLSIIVMTGHTDSGTLRRLEDAPTLGFLEKPFSVNDLKVVLEKWIDGRR